MTHCCQQMERHLNDGEVAIVYVDEYRDYGIKVLDGGCSFQHIHFCPWCGKQLPQSLRMTYFERLDAIGKEPGDDFPPQFQSGEWWRAEGL
jgi:hypothetical protein